MQRRSRLEIESGDVWVLSQSKLSVCLVLNSWIQKTPLEGMLAQAEEREREREAERSARIAKDEERQRQSCGSSPSLHPAGSPSLHQSRS